MFKNLFKAFNMLQVVVEAMSSMMMAFKLHHPSAMQTFLFQGNFHSELKAIKAEKLVQQLSSNTSIN